MSEPLWKELIQDAKAIKSTHPKIAARLRKAAERLKTGRVIDKILAGHAAGLSPKRIAEAYAISPQCVRVRLSQLGLTSQDPAEIERKRQQSRRGYVVPPDKEADFRVLRRNGYSLKEAAEALKIEVPTL